MQLFNRTIKAIIFDHDGTLVDSEAIHCGCWNTVLARHGCHLNFSDYCQNYNGLPTLETASRLQEQFALPLPAQDLYAAKNIALNAYLEKQPFPLLPGVLATLNTLREVGIPLAIASGANRHEVLSSVRGHALGTYFNVVSTKNDVTQSKPAPDVYLHAASQLQVAPTHCLAIEDSDTGEQAARAAGMPCIRLISTPKLPFNRTLQCSTMETFHACLLNEILGGKSKPY